ncbi:MAG: ELM1/GtrOC1 family putative glycosyltransferase, partial [Candidatus Porifericomitaceae bacterium WSBS_2022_MAG_OTU9]
EEFIPPWPELAISNGSSAIAAAVAVKRAAGDKVFSLHMQTAAAATKYFDLVVVPKHQRPPRRENEFPLLGSFEDFSIQKPVVEKDFIKGLPSPVVAILLGGNNKTYLLDAQTALDLSGRLASAISAVGGSFLLSASRRTPAESFAIFRRQLAHLPGQSWSSADNGGNPYANYMASADIYAVSCDSVNMLSEACAMCKPVYILPLKRRFMRSGGKFQRLHKQLITASVARIFASSLGSWQTPGLQEGAKLLEKVLASL